jgi:hypothetical protein
MRVRSRERGIRLRRSLRRIPGPWDRPTTRRSDSAEGGNRRRVESFARGAALPSECGPPKRSGRGRQQTRDGRGAAAQPRREPALPPSAPAGRRLRALAMRPRSRPLWRRSDSGLPWRSLDFRVGHARGLGKEAGDGARDCSSVRPARPHPWLLGSDHHEIGIPGRTRIASSASRAAIRSRSDRDLDHLSFGRGGRASRRR